MPRYAWIETVDEYPTVKDYCDGLPTDLYHPAIAANYSTTIPTNVERGWRYKQNQWVAPSVPEPFVPGPPPPPEEPSLGRIISPAQFLMLFTPLERVAIRNSTDAVVVDFIRLVELPSLTQVELDNPQTQMGVQYLVSEGLITSERATAILAAQPLG
jgi:hypothetical protein